MTASVVAGVALVAAFVGDPDTAARGESNFHFIALLGCRTALKRFFLFGAAYGDGLGKECRTSAATKEFWRELEFSHGTKSGSVHLIPAMSWLFYFPFTARWVALGNKSLSGQDRAFAKWMSSLSATHLVRPSIFAIASRPTSQPMRWHWAAKAG